MRYWPDSRYRPPRCIECRFSGYAIDLDSGGEATCYNVSPARFIPNAAHPPEWCPFVEAEAAIIELLQKVNV